MELSIERTEENFKKSEIPISENFQTDLVVESSEISVPVEKIDEATIVASNVNEINSLNEKIPVTLKNETVLDCSLLSPQGLDIVNVVSLKIEDFNKLNQEEEEKTDVLDINDDRELSIEIEVEEEAGYEEEAVYNDEDDDEDEEESEIDDEQSFPVKNLDSSTIILDDDDEEEEDEDEEEDDEDLEEDEEEDIDEDDSDIEEIPSSPIKKTPNDYDPMEGTSSNIQGDWDRWRIKKKKELEEAAIIEERPIPMTMKPRRRTFLQRIKKRSIKW